MRSVNTSTLPAAALRSRTDALVALFDSVAQTRMSGVPILNPALRVDALGFELCQGVDAGASPPPRPSDQAKASDPAGAVGILITPWCMNLVWFPLARLDMPSGSGHSRSRRVGAECFDFIGGYEPIFGNYEACSLFSPMFEFADHAAARATAHAVLETLRQPALVPLFKAPSLAPAKPVSQTPPPALAARRAFLFGRRPPTAGAV
jgi:[NiFe] hydrogenase assembly HybE family chaperone